MRGLVGGGEEGLRDLSEPSIKKTRALYLAAPFPKRCFIHLDLCLSRARRGSIEAEEDAGRLRVAFTVIPLPRKRRQRDAKRSRRGGLRIDDAGIKGHPEMLACELLAQRGSRGRRLEEVAIRDSPPTSSFFISQISPPSEENFRARDT